MKILEINGIKSNCKIGVRSSLNWFGRPAVHTFCTFSSFLFLRLVMSLVRFFVSSIFFQVFISSCLSRAILLANSCASLSMLISQMNGVSKWNTDVVLLLCIVGTADNGINDVHTLFFSSSYLRDSSSEPGRSGLVIQLAVVVAVVLLLQVMRPYY